MAALDPTLLLRAVDRQMTAPIATTVGSMPAIIPSEVDAGGETRAEYRNQCIGVQADPALVIAGIHKSFTAGVPGCSARARVLVDASLLVAPGEVVGVAGSAGAGKTTFLLCAAGLMRPDQGRVAWFGECPGDRSTGARAPEYLRLRDLSALRRAERALASGARLLLVDHADPAPLDELRGALGRALARHGSALVIASRDRSALARIASRLLTIRDGRLHAIEPLPALPAES